MNFGSPQDNASQVDAPIARERYAGRLSKFENSLRLFTPGERLFLYVLIGILAISAFLLIVRANTVISTLVPAEGGSFSEGVVGSARFINPLLALSGPDRDLTALVYSGLMRPTPEGSLIPDLAERYEISEDGTVYTFTLRDGLTFHDGTSLSADDVVFTIQRAQDPSIKSPQRADWEGVIVSKVDERTISFALPHAYAPFLENTTLGVLPAHLWRDVSVEEFPFHPLNTHPIGSGPYKVVDFDTNSTGAATLYRLSSFDQFALGKPYIRSVSLQFFPNETALVEAFDRGRVDSVAGITPSRISDLSRSDAFTVRSPLPRTFGVFFNQNKNTHLADLAVRRALDAAVNKERVVNEVLYGYGAVLEGPIPPGLLGDTSPALPTMISTDAPLLPETNDHAENARDILERNDWTWDEDQAVWTKKDAVLALTLATADEPELAATAEAVAREWRAAGIRIDVHVYDLSELNSLVIRPRNYDAILFGEIVGRSLDLFAFWHSSQRNDPGLNLALYTNSSADKALADARATTARSEREKLYEEFVGYVQEDTPAVFLYAPEFVYFVDDSLLGIKLGALSTPAERFLNVYEWHTHEERVWSIFAN